MARNLVNDIQDDEEEEQGFNIGALGSETEDDSSDDECINELIAALSRVSKKKRKINELFSWNATYYPFAGVAVAVSLVQSLTAISLMYYNVVWFNPLGMTLAMRKKLHGICGALSFVVGYVALVLSLYSKFMEKNCSENLW